MRFSLRQLEYVIAVAQAGNFGRAAETCAVTQSALSQQIARLEEACDTLIFDRDQRPVRLTPFGEEFVSRAAALISDAKLLDDFAGRNATFPNRPLRFALIPTVAPYLLPRIYPELVSRLPDVQFVAVERKTDAIIEELTDGRLDLAIIGTDIPDGAPLTGQPLFSDAFVLARQKGLHASPEIQLSEIDPATLLLLEEGHCLRDQALSACGVGQSGQQKPFSATSLATITELVANGQGTTLLPEISLAKEARDHRIELVPLASPGAGRLLSLVWRRHSPFTALFKTCAAVIGDMHASTRSTDLDAQQSILPALAHHLHPER